MSWTTIRIREETKDDLQDLEVGSNMDEKVQYLLGNIETYIEQIVRQEVAKISINRQTGELEY